MSPLSLLLLLVSTAGAFSPPGQLRLSTNRFISQSLSSRCTASSPHRLQTVVQTEPLLQCLSMSSSPSTIASTTASKERQFTYKKRTAIFMAFMTGWADYIFIKKYNFFATMMTGNSMKMANALVDGRITDTFFFLSVIISYIVGVGTFRRAELSYKDKALNGLFAPIVAGCFIWSDYLSFVGASKFIPAILLSFAWGIINSVGSEVTGTLIFVVTGAMTRVANMIVDRISRTAGRKKIPREGLLMSTSVIGGFILGAAWSAALSVKAPTLTSRGVFSIMGAIYGLLFLWLDRSELGAWWLRKNGKLCEISADEVDCN